MQSNNIDFQEVIGFAVYHALESISCAVIVHCRSTIPSQHEDKLIIGVRYCKRYLSNSVNVRELAKLVSILNNFSQDYGYRKSFRSKFLYPEFRQENEYISPQNQITLQEVSLLIRGVNYIMSQIIKAIS